MPHEREAWQAAAVKPDPMLDAPWWVADWVPDVDDERAIERFGRIVWVVLLAGVLALVVRGADEPADPYLPSQRTEQVESSGGP